MSGTKRSNIWKFYSEDVENEKMAKCTLCNAKISRGGTGKAATATAMVNHLKYKHFNEHLEYLQLQKKDQDARQQKVVESKKTTAESQLRQQTIQESVQSRQPFDINDPRAQAVHIAIAEMIAVDNEPLSVLNKQGFQRLMKVLQPRYAIPSRTHFAEKIIPNLYKKCKLAVSRKLSFSKISFTTDIWTCDYNKESFISFTAHFISTDFYLEHYVLNVKHFPGTHSAAAIGGILEDLSNSWSIEKNKIHVIVSDNAYNITKAIRDSDIQSVHCFNHTLQLVINDALKSQRVVIDTIAVAKKIVGHFNSSSLAYDHLRKIQLQLNLPVKRLKQDLPTRWNSTFYLMERLSEQKRPVSLYIIDHSQKITNLTQNQWNIIEACVSLLRPFEEVTRKMSSSDCLLSEVIPTANMLKHFLSDSAAHPAGLGTMIETLQNSLSERFANIENNKLYQLATILDPRFKCIFFKENVDAEAIILHHLDLEEAEDFFVPQPSVEPAASTSQQKKNKPTKDSESPAKKIRRNESESEPVESEFVNVASGSNTTNLWESYKKQIVTQALDKNKSGDASTSTRELIKIEVKSFFSSPILDRDIDPILWWRNNKNLYPQLTKLAVIYLGAPATSTYSERIFSEAGNIYTQKRSVLRPELAESLLFLHHNLPRINFKY